MSCTLANLSGYKNGCKEIGGISEVYLIDKSTRENVEDLVLAVTAGAMTITPGATSPDAYKLKARENNWALAQPSPSDNTAGSVFVEQNLTGVLHGYTAALVALAGDLAKGRLEAVAKTRSGTYIYLGYTPDANGDDVATGLQDNGSDFGIGAGAGDGNGLTVALQSQGVSRAPTLTFSEFEAAFTITEAA